MKHHRRRLDFLEKQIISEQILLRMPNGDTQRLPGHPNYLLDLMMRSLDGEQRSEMDLIAQSITADEPGRAHMIDVARLLYAAVRKQMQPGQSSVT
ncbi:MAG TPA: hypothetical protein VGN17_01380 [Bryobacteraceae bacterium]|jgi:hypothetical protein